MTVMMTTMMTAMVTVSSVVCALRHCIVAVHCFMVVTATRWMIQQYHVLGNASVFPQEGGGRSQATHSAGTERSSRCECSDSL
jgi:hypothetical protein